MTPTTVHDISSHEVQFFVDSRPAIYKPMYGGLPGAAPMHVLSIPVEALAKVLDIDERLKVKDGHVNARSKNPPPVTPNVVSVRELSCMLQDLDAMNRPRDDIFRGASVKARVTLRKVCFDPDRLDGRGSSGEVHQLHLDQVTLTPRIRL